MKLEKELSWQAGAFVFCFVACGCIFWRGSYQEYMGTAHWEWVPLFAVVALLLTWIVGARIILSVLAVGCAFPAAILVRVMLDCSADPTNHNLWPFEVVLASFFAMILAVPAAGLGWLLRRVTHGRHQAGNQAN